MPTRDELKILQAYPLEIKIRRTQQRIREWVNFYGENGVYVSFSGGKDSTVLLHLVRQMYPNIEAVFVDTGLEYPEIRSFVKSFDNVTILRPKMRFDEVIRKYGYPFIGKEIAESIYQGRLSLKSGKYTYRLKKLRGEAVDKDGRKSLFNQEKYEPLLHIDFVISNYCCKIMKKDPSRKFERESGKLPIMGLMAEESRLREQIWLKNGCNAFNSNHKASNPMSFWTEQDILQYIKCNSIPIASVYGEIVKQNNNDGFQYAETLCDCDCKYKTTGCDRTGCIFCAFGAHLTPKNQESRFQRLKRTHPRQYEYCMNGGGYDIDGFWKPTKDGLGMAHCIDELNKLYGKDFIKY